MNNINNLIKEGSLLVVGNAILAVAVGVFILPSNVLSGGVAGIAVLLEPFIEMPKEMMVTILTVVLFFVGLLFMGKAFALKTLASSLLYPIFLNVIMALELNVSVSPLMASLYGGLLAGIAIGIVIKSGASTGGMDIPPIVLHKFTNVEISKLIMVVDAITVGCGLFIYGLEPVLIGFVSVFTTSFGISKVMSFPWGKAKAVQIISSEWEVINERINVEMNRGSTLSSAQGGFTREPKTIILVVVDNYQYVKLIDIINEVDPTAFVITNETNQVHGEGFTLEARI